VKTLVATPDPEFGPSAAAWRVVNARFSQDSTDHPRDELHGARVGGLLDDQEHAATHPRDVVEQHDPPTDQRAHGIKKVTVGGHPLTTSQTATDAQRGLAGGDPSRPPTTAEAKPTASSSVGTFSAQATCLPQTHGAVAWAELRITADLFDRAQQERIAVANLIRRPEDGGNIDPVFFAAHLDRLTDVEHQAKLMLGRVYRRTVPTELRAWQTESPGVGAHLFARLLGHLGDPYIATPHYWEGTGSARTLMIEEPRVRTIGQLWQFCGHGAPARRTRGMTAEQLAAQGSPLLKMLVHLNAEACMKQPNGTRYRDIYVAAKAATEGKTHTTECVRCGPSGKPAQPGSPWNDGHRHAHALRIVGKELLRDMWLARHHAETSAPNPPGEPS
jgi:hypothetical protein